MKQEKKYAIKEFRKKRKDEGQREYVKKLMGEFCIRYVIYLIGRLAQVCIMTISSRL
jgi:protein-serine/threonine kinase